MLTFLFVFFISQAQAQTPNAKSQFDVKPDGKIINPEGIPALPADPAIAAHWKCNWIKPAPTISELNGQRFCSGSIACSNEKIEELSELKLMGQIRCIANFNENKRDPVGNNSVCDIIYCFKNDLTNKTNYNYKGKQQSVPMPGSK